MVPTGFVNKGDAVRTLAERSLHILNPRAV